MRAGEEAFSKHQLQGLQVTDTDSTMWPGELLLAGLLALTSVEPLGSINSLRNVPGAFSGMGICGLYGSAAGLAQPKGGLQVKQEETDLPASLGKFCLGRRWDVFWTDWRRIPICRSRSSLGRVQASRRRLRTGWGQGPGSQEAGSRLPGDRTRAPASKRLSGQAGGGVKAGEGCGLSR